jgi:O-antigen ligase
MSGTLDGNTTFLARSTSTVARQFTPSVVRERSHRLACCCAVAAGFTIPLATSPTVLLFALLFLCWLLSGDFREKWRVISQSGIAWLATGLFAVHLISLAYTPASFADAVAMLSKYRNLLYVPILITIFSDRRVRDLGLSAFLAAMTIALVGSYLMRFGWVHSRWGGIHDCAVFKNHTTQNVLMAFFAYLVALEAVRRPAWRWVCVTVLLLAGYDILFLVQGRTGFVVLAALMVLFLWQQAGTRGLLYSGVALIVGAVSVYSVSDNFRSRMDKGVAEFTEYASGTRGVAVDSRNSIGLRLLFYENSLQLAKRAPLFGSGAGGFAYRYGELAKKEGLVGSVNPHNEYLLVLVQTGLVGLTLLLLLFAVGWRDAAKLEIHNRQIAQAVVVTVVTGCLLYSLLLDTTEGAFYSYFTGLCFGGLHSGSANEEAPIPTTQP